MARLYNGFNALALGQAINNTNDAVHQRRLSGLNALGGALQDFARSYQEEEEKKRQRQSAMDFLTGNGMSPENAQAMVNSGIAPGELTKYMQGRLDKIEDLNAANARADFEYGRAREDKLNDEEWNREMDNLDKMQESHEKRKNEIEDKEFNALNTRYQLLLSKQQSGVLMSKAERAELAQVKEQLDKWLWKHPDYTQMNIDYGNGDGDNEPWTIERANDELNGLVEKDGKVDPAKLKALDEKYLHETGRTLVNDLPDLYKNIAQKQRGSKGKRNAYNPNSGSVPTEEDYKKAWDNAQKAEHLNKLLNDVKQALIRGGGYPNLSDDEKKLLTYKDKATMGQYNRIMARKGK